MFSKNTILLVILLLLVGASGVLLYSVLGDRSIALDVPKQVSNQDVIIRNEVDKLDTSIRRAIRKLENGGDLDRLTNGQQFRQLTTEYIKDIQVPAYGRTNPFDPVDYSEVE